MSLPCCSCAFSSASFIACMRQSAPSGGERVHRSSNMTERKSTEATRELSRRFDGKAGVKALCSRARDLAASVLRLSDRAWPYNLKLYACTMLSWG